MSGFVYILHSKPAQLICVFVFPYAKSRFSHEAHLQVGPNPAVFHGDSFSSTDSRTAVTGERLGMKYLKNFL